MISDRFEGTLHVGMCRVWLHMPENASLKDKRQVLRSLMQRVRNKFDVAIAEVDAQDQRQLACLGITCVSGNGRHANQILSRVIDFIQRSRPDAELYEYEREVHTF